MGKVHFSFQIFWGFCKYCNIQITAPAPYLNQMHFWILSYLDYRTGLWSWQNHGSIKPGLNIHLFQLPRVRLCDSDCLWQGGGHGSIQRTKQPIIAKKRMKGTYTIQPFLQLPSLALPQWTCIVDCQQFISGESLTFSPFNKSTCACVLPLSVIYLVSISPTCLKYKKYRSLWLRKHQPL